METKQTRFLACLEAGTAACKAKQAQLIADDRADEATFEAVRANIYQIFHTVFGVAWKISDGDETKARSFFAEKLEQLPRNWQDSLTRAEAHGDAEKAHIERIKLEVRDEIARTFAELWREEA